jgi:hypothetical protein
MAPKVFHHAKQAPRSRLSAKERGYFFPGEAARILGLSGIDYHQLRRLLVVASGPRPKPLSRRWARFSYSDLVMVKAAVKLAGGIGALRVGRHLQLKRVRDACAALQRTLGVQNPLSSVKLVLEGRSIVAHLDGVAFEPVSGQLLLDVATSIDREVPDVGPRLRTRLKAERKELLEGVKLDRSRFGAKAQVRAIRDHQISSPNSKSPRGSG